MKGINALDGIEYARQFVRQTVRATIMKQSARDQQSSVGPSDLGDPCDLCLASKMARHGPLAVGQGRESGFSLSAWVGTSMHEKLERDLDLPPEMYLCEEKVFIHEIPGYGRINGHIDVQFLLMGIWNDYKSAKVKDIQSYKLNGPPWKHVVQLMLYGYGLRKAGRKADYAALTYIPRDNNNPDSIWVATAEYNEQIALDALARAEAMWAKLQDGHIDFSSHPDCYVCKMATLGMLR